MSLFGKFEARPYVVTMRDKGGTMIVKHVIAYDMAEALMAASLEVQAEGGECDATVSIVPDEEALARRDQQRFVDAVTRRLLSRDER